MTHWPYSQYSIPYITPVSTTQLVYRRLRIHTDQSTVPLSCFVLDSAKEFWSWHSHSPIRWNAWSPPQQLAHLSPASCEYLTLHLEYWSKKLPSTKFWHLESNPSLEFTNRNWRRASPKIPTQTVCENTNWSDCHRFNCVTTALARRRTSELFTNYLQPER